MTRSSSGPLPFAHSGLIGNARSALDVLRERRTSFELVPISSVADRLTNRPGAPREGLPQPGPEPHPTENRSNPETTTHQATVRHLEHFDQIAGSLLGHLHGLCRTGPSLVPIEGKCWLMLITELLGPSLEQRQLFIPMSGTDVIIQLLQALTPSCFRDSPGSFFVSLGGGYLVEHRDVDRGVTKQSHQLRGGGPGLGCHRGRSAA